MFKVFSLAISISLFSLSSFAEKFPVSNPGEIKDAERRAKPGDEIILLTNGEWNNVSIEIKANGTEKLPIIYRGETPGSLKITGNSDLKIGGSYLIVDGWYFTNGYAGKDAVIDFKINKSKLANHCTVRNTVINAFNNPKRMDENYWVSLSGKNNIIEKCTFINKNNMGVLMAVLLDDDKSRENNHLIRNNYFGQRLPLASNSGEIIRIGVSQHCQYNSFTKITGNFFEKCDGETEIISVKSGGNAVLGNVFKECQGGVVLRHGDGNTVAGNIFLGNDKEGTGGVRVINKGHWIYNNFFYKCRGEGFRSPLVIMNGVFNSPANRYVQVSDVIIAANTFWDCAPASLCEGSDTERTESPIRTYIIKNYFKIFRDTAIYKAHDDISGIRFVSNEVNGKLRQKLPNGFSFNQTASMSKSLAKVGDSAILLAQKDTSARFTPDPPYTNLQEVIKRSDKIISECRNWFTPRLIVKKKSTRKINCKDAGEMMSALSKIHGQVLEINLSGTNYIFKIPVNITEDVVITSPKTGNITFTTEGEQDHLFHLVAGNSFILKNIKLDLQNLKVNKFLTTDTSGSSNHGNFQLLNSSISNLKGTFFHASKSTLCDSVIVNKNFFTNNKGLLFDFMQETDKKGYYNVEKIKLTNNVVVNHEEQIISMLRGGNDESTMGPLMIFENNSVRFATSSKPLIYLYGSQKTFVRNNAFENANKDGELLRYDDAVRSWHVLRNNSYRNSGKVITNKFVTE